MITFGVFDFLILLIGWIIIWGVLLPDDFKEELGFTTGLLIMLGWFVGWVVLFPIMKLHLVVSFVWL